MDKIIELVEDLRVWAKDKRGRELTKIYFLFALVNYDVISKLSERELDNFLEMAFVVNEKREEWEVAFQNVKKIYELPSPFRDEKVKYLMTTNPRQNSNAELYGNRLRRIRQFYEDIVEAIFVFVFTFDIHFGHPGIPLEDILRAAGIDPSYADILREAITLNEMISRRRSYGSININRERRNNNNRDYSNDGIIDKLLKEIMDLNHKTAELAREIADIKKNR